MPNPDLEADRPAERVITRNNATLCAGCETPFVRVRPHQRYCRPSCRVRGWQRHRQQQGEARLLDALERVLPDDPGRAE